MSGRAAQASRSIQPVAVAQPRHDGEKIRKGQVLVEWDAHRTPILAEKSGLVRFKDIEIGETVKLAYVDQSRDVLNPDHTIWESISEGKDVIQLGSREINRVTEARIVFVAVDEQGRKTDLVRRARPGAAS